EASMAPQVPVDLLHWILATLAIVALPMFLAPLRWRASEAEPMRCCRSCGFLAFRTPWEGSKKCASCSRRPQQVCLVNKENRNALLRRRLHFPQFRNRRFRGIYVRPLVLAAHYSHWRLIPAS